MSMKIYVVVSASGGDPEVYPDVVGVRATAREAYELARDDMDRAWKGLVESDYTEAETFDELDLRVSYRWKTGSNHEIRTMRWKVVEQELPEP